MTLMDKFYNKLTQEYNDYMEEVSNWDGEVVYNNAEFISDYEKIYNYLISEKPITENAFLDHFVRMNKPLRTLCEYYQKAKPPVQEHINPIIWLIGTEKRFDKNFSIIKADFMERIEENYAMKKPDVHNDEYKMRDYLKHHITLASDKDVITLMQFQNPLKLLIESPKVEGMTEKIAMTAHHVRFMDVMTMPYALDTDRLVPEAIHRHKAVESLMQIIPKHDFNTSMLWLDSLRSESGISYEETMDKSNPYESFTKTIGEILEEHGKDVVQTIYDSVWGYAIPEDKLTEVAKYIADDGDIMKVPRLVEHGYFDERYENNFLTDDEFFEKLSNENNGMTML